MTQRSTEPTSASPRRHHSEIDMNSLRRVSEALLLAQNRARLATERANRCERVLRMVMAQVNPQVALSLRNELDGDTDWDMLQSVALEQSSHIAGERQSTTSTTSTTTISLTSAIIQNYEGSSPRRRHSLDGTNGNLRLVEEEVPSIVANDANENNDALWASMIAPERNLDVAILAKEIVENLHAAAVRGHERVQKMHRQHELNASSSHSRNRNWLDAWKQKLMFRIELYAISPLQFMTGILMGVVVGMTVTRQLLLRRQGVGGKSNQLLKILSSSPSKQRSPDAACSAFQYFPYGDDDMSYMMHPGASAVEVA
ncbi:hypothetical protein FI667_g10760, partial [Globisporangium splendens]